MSVKSVFEFTFSESAREEGLTLVEGVGNDMPPLGGYLDHELLQDFADPGHLVLETRWGSRDQANAVLAQYQHDAKIQRITALLSGPPTGFVGNVLS